MDSLQYFYDAGTNQLNHVRDKINASNFPNDIDNQNPNNYTYDPTGNLIKDQAENLSISWTHYGKVKNINKNNAPLLTFEYDATGNRSVKYNHQTNEKQIYIRDAQGNVMAVYQARHDSLFLDGHHLYGSSRLGMIKEQQFLTKKLTGGTPPPPQITPFYTLKLYTFGKKRYELTDWLGNVRVVINDKKTPMGTNPSNMTYQAQTISVSDYYPFGMLARNYNADVYRFGFNTQEKDDEVFGITGAFLSWGNYGYDSRLGRRWNIDPQWQRLPEKSTYSVNNDNPIQFTDPDGEFGFIGAAIGAVVGAAVELGSQVVSNAVQGKPLFKSIDWADVAISAGEGAIAGATGGASLLVTQVGSEALKASVDFTDGQFRSVGGIIGKEKDLGQAGIDFAGGLIGMGAGKLLPVENAVKDVVADQFLKEGIKSEGQFLTGMIVSDLAGGLTNSIIGGATTGLFNRGVDALKGSGDGSDIPTITLPVVEISAKRNEVTPEGKITSKGEKKIQEHIKKEVDKRR